MNKSKDKVHFLSCGRWLDASEFLKYFERKVLYTIRKYELIGKKDKIAVAFSGGKDSITLLYILAKFCKERGQKLVALSIDEGIGDYRTKLLEDSKKFCKDLGISLKIISFKKEFGFNLSDKRVQQKIKKMKLSNCAVSSILKRWLMNKKARELKFDVIATAHSLDDEAENILLNIFKGNSESWRNSGLKQELKKLKHSCSESSHFIFARRKK